MVDRVAGGEYDDKDSLVDPFLEAESFWDSNSRYGSSELVMFMMRLGILPIVIPIWCFLLRLQDLR